MSNNKKSSLFPFYKSDYSQDWELSGYYYNWQLSSIYVPKDVLKSFKTPTVSGIKQPPTEITIRKIAIKGNTKTIINSNTYSVNMYSRYLENYSKTEYYFIQSSFTDDPNQYLDEGCTYEIYIEDADGNAFISNVFIAIDETQIYITAESGEIIIDEQSGESIVFE